MEDNKVKIKMAPPWVQYANAMQAFFAEDPDVTVIYNNDECLVRVLVDGQDKADALAELLPKEVDCGAEKLQIRVVPGNVEYGNRDLFARAFSGNPAVERLVRIDGVFTNPLTYVVFKKTVVQYFNDNLGDLNGNRSTLYQEIAAELFTDRAGVLFCTDTGDEK